MVKFSNHAKERWAERFPERIIEVEYCRARLRIGKKMRKVIKASCPAHTHFWKKSFNGRYGRMTCDGIVFVIAPPETVITVLDFTNKTNLTLNRRKNTEA